MYALKKPWDTLFTTPNLSSLCKEFLSWIHISVARLGGLFAEQNGERVGSLWTQPGAWQFFVHLAIYWQLFRSRAPWLWQEDVVQPMPHALEEGYQIGWLDILRCSISGAFCDWEVLKSSVWSECCETYVSLLDAMCIMNLMLYEIGSKFCFIWIGPRSGFTDFQSLTFYNATFSNPGQCGDLLAETVDLDAVLRFPSEGDGPANPGGLG